MKKRIFTLLFIALVTALPNTVSASLYSDVNNDTWYLDSIIQLNEYEIMTGNPDGTFSPDKCINRAEILKVLMEVSAPDEMEALQESNYTDLNDPSQWYYPYIMQATELGYVQGYPDGTFKPAQCVKRVEALKMALEVFEIEVYNEYLLTHYIDVSMSEWYSDYFFTAWDLEVLPEKHVVDYQPGSFVPVKGYFPSEFMPRKEAAALINNLISYMILNNENSAHDAARKAFLNSIVSAVESFNIDNGYYPQGVFCIGDEVSPETDEAELLEYLSGGSLKLNKVASNPVVCNGEAVRYEELEAGYQVFIQVEGEGSHGVSDAYDDQSLISDPLDRTPDGPGPVTDAFAISRD